MFLSFIVITILASALLLKYRTGARVSRANMPKDPQRRSRVAVASLEPASK